MEHYKNLDLADIVYFCEFDLVWKTEQWKDVIDYEGLYQVSDLGRVKSIKIGTNRKNKILKPNIRIYSTIDLAKNKKRRTMPIHKIVSMAFLNHIPCGHKLVVNHKNFNKIDNRLKNLEIITQRENSSKTYLNPTGSGTFFYWCAQYNKWIIKRYTNKKVEILGLFNTELEAIYYYKNKLYTEI